MNGYAFLFGSSVGKKMVMAATGLCMIAFLSVHLLGNLMAFAGADAFNGYAAKLHALQPYLTVFNLGLLAVGMVHVMVGAMLFFENRRARPVRYAVCRSPGGRTTSSDTMPWTGLLILLFVVLHLARFTFTDKSIVPIYQLMAATFQSPLWVLLHVAAVAVLALHIRHGFWSMFQTLGLNHPDHMDLVMAAALAAAVIFTVGFGVLPIHLLIAA